MQVEEILSQLNYLNTYQKLDDYHPYEYQKRFHFAKADGKLAMIRGLMAGNQVGKTKCAAYEVAMHLTGRYPDWWEGRRFLKPITVLAGTNTNEQTRDLLQAELFGEPTEKDSMGTGAVPKVCIKDTNRKPGVPNALDSVIVKHATLGEYDGDSKIMFRAYEQGAKKHMGFRIHLGWMDEEPPADVYAQYHRGTIATHGALMLTMTPENGLTEVVDNLLNNPSKGMTLVQATWDDVDPAKNKGRGHLTEDRQKVLLAQMSPHEREMRSKGLPQMGSGLIFPVKDEDLMCEPFQIPEYWPRIIGIDFGWDHPFAAAWLAEDRETETVYVYKTFRESNVRIPMAADVLKRGHGDRIPVTWPHDGMHHDKSSGKPLADLYREYGLNLLPNCFSNPPAPGQKEGQGGQGVEVGLMAILTAMEEGRFKVFSTERNWFEEKNIYHRKDRKIVKVRDDLMSATRYAYQSLRYADNEVPVMNYAPQQRGLRNW